MDDLFEKSFYDLPSFDETDSEDDFIEQKECLLPEVDQIDSTPFNDIELLYDEFVSKNETLCIKNPSKKTIFLQSYKHEETKGFLEFSLRANSLNNQKYFYCQNFPDKRRKKNEFKCNFRATKISETTNEIKLTITNHHSRKCFENCLINQDFFNSEKSFFDPKLVSKFAFDCFRINPHVKPYQVFNMIVEKYPNLSVSQPMIQNRLSKLREQNQINKYLSIVRIKPLKLTLGTTAK